jgi:hypothetical protein
MVGGWKLEVGGWRFFPENGVKTSFSFYVIIIMFEGMEISNGNDHTL